MATRIFDSATWIKIGQPDLNSKMYYTVKGKRIYGEVIAISHINKGIKLRIKPFKSKHK